MDITENINFDKTAWAEKKKSLREEVFARIDEYLDQMPAEPHCLQAYLDVQARFPSCSVSNAILIADQKPDAYEYHTFEDWKNKGVSIMKGEQGFSMLVPNGSYTGKDGMAHTRFDVQKVFDISQTSGMIVPMQEDLQLVLKAMLMRPIVPIQVVEQKAGAEFMLDENQITIGRGMTVMEGIQTLSIALAHGELSRVLPNYDPTLPTNSFYARCASYVICRHYGVEPTSYNFLDVQSILGNLNGKEIRSQLEIIRTAARSLIDRVEKARTALLNMSKQEQEQERESR